MSPQFLITLAIFMLSLFLPACSTPTLRIQTDVVPPGTLRVAQVTEVGKREDILKLEAVHKSIIAAGVDDSDLVDGSVAMARIYCCGGMSYKYSSEFVTRLMLYVPKGLKVGVGDFVEIKAGRPPENEDNGRLNTVTRVLEKQGDQAGRCWWDPRDDRLWLRVPYCEWMVQEGWVKQDGVNPAWYKSMP
jgi:hypothetical protein